ncbi:hypothetical protein Msub_11234 [Marinobacter subterrani]|uniref:Uncharacterized protein n=1 Tax=Marinobacter subterrani TaxID=1658765 RepID=A0A0J7M1T4_9GAMM|nr:hypothetical protein Msub_11234 [Marinobacter subterrani]
MFERFLNLSRFHIFSSVCISAVTLILLGYWLEVLIPRSVPVIYGALAFIFVSGTRWSRAPNIVPQPL